MTGASTELNELATALVKAQAAFPSITPDGTGQVGQGKYKYATLAHVIDGVKPVLAANDLAFMQTGEPCNPGVVRLTTTLLHKSGQWLSGTIELPAGSTPQTYGSALTYARRYSLAALLGLAVDEDDDGKSASQPARRESAPRTATQPNLRDSAPQPQQRPPAPTPIGTPLMATVLGSATDGQWRAFYATLKGDLGISYEDAKDLIGVESMKKELAGATFGMVIQRCKDALAKRQALA